MKRATSLIVIIIACLFIFSSCRKNYTCTCTFNGGFVYSQEIKSKTKSDAKDACSKNDSTVAGEVWNCNLQ